MSNSTCPHQNLKVKHVVTLLEEVQSRYVNKLSSINNKQITSEERDKQKIIIYESYVKDLSLQSRLLLQSLDELEREANQRVALLESRLKKTAGVSTAEAGSRHENLQLKHDVDVLAAFVRLGQRTGKWSTDTLRLKTLSLDLPSHGLQSSCGSEAEIHSKTARIAILEEELNEKKRQYEERILDLSAKLRTISDRHRESTALINADVQAKNQQIEQLRQQCSTKDASIVDLQTQIHRPAPVPLEPTVPKIEYDTLDQELQTTRKQLDAVMFEMRNTDTLNCKLEQDLRLFKKFHDDQFEQQIKSHSVAIDQLQTEIRALKQTCHDKTDELHKHASELRSCQERFSVTEQEKQQLRNRLQLSEEQSAQFSAELQQNAIKLEQAEQRINDVVSHRHLLESKLIEAMELVDQRNRALIDHEERLKQTHNEQAEKQSRIEQLEQSIANKTTESTQLADKLQVERDNAMKAMQREIEHLSSSLAERDRAITALNEQRERLAHDLRAQQNEARQIEKSLNKQLATKQDQLVRYDQNLHEAEIRHKYAQEECLIQEKELARLNWVQEEQEHKIRLLQEDLLKTQAGKEAMTTQYERIEGELDQLKHLRDEENRRYHQEFDKLNTELTALRVVEVTLLRNIDELKENLSLVSAERNEIRQQHQCDCQSMQNIQQILSDETESNSKSAAKVLLLSRQLEDEQKRLAAVRYELNDVQMQLSTASLTIETLNAELSQSRSLSQDYLDKEAEMKQHLNRLKSAVDERSKALDERQREIATLNQLMSHLHADYDKSKSELSNTQDKVLHLEVENETIRKRFHEKINELTDMDRRLQENLHDFHAYERTHRYSNEEFVAQEQQNKEIENELISVNQNYEKLQRAHQTASEQLEQYRDELELSEKSETIHQEQLQRSLDGAMIYKQKLTLLGGCFKTIMRKASETSEQWVDLTTRLDELIAELSHEAEHFHSLAERFEQSLQLSQHLRVQHDDAVAQFSALKTHVDKIHAYLREHQRRCTQTRDENLHLRMETKRLRDQIEGHQRTESAMQMKRQEQEIGLTQLRKELSYELHGRSDAQRTIEQLKHTLDETTHERNQCVKNIALAHKQISASTDENRLLQQTVQQLSEQIRIQSESFEQSERLYEEKIHEYETVLLSFTETNREVKSDPSRQMEKNDETSQEFQQHITTLEQSIEEHKRLVRKRELELEKIQNESESNVSHTSPMSLTYGKHRAESDAAHSLKVSIPDELRILIENGRSGEDHLLSDLCVQRVNGINGANMSRSCVLRNAMNDGENSKSGETVWFPFGPDLTFGMNEHVSTQKKYKLMKAYSKQQQFLLNQLETQVQFYESIFSQRCLPAIQGAGDTSVVENNPLCEEKL